MGKIIWIVAALILIGVAVWFANQGGQVVASGIENDLKFKIQAEIEYKIPNQINAMKQFMALGTANEFSAKPILDDAQALHALVEDAKVQLVKLGDSPEQIASWLDRIQWPECQRVEAQLRKAAAPDGNR